MPPRRRVDPRTGHAALQRWREGGALEREAMGRKELATAVRYTLEELAVRHPGGAVEVRVPPHGAVQCLTGTRHRRGTPPSVVETDAGTWLAVVTGERDWDEAVAAGALRASGERSDLGTHLPLW